MIKKSVLIALLGMGLSLQAGIFDDAMKQAESYTQSSQKTTETEQESAGLLSALTGNLGITDKQAAGGTAALMSTAAQSMPQTNYAELLKSVPGLSSLVQGNETLVNGAAQMLGNSDMVGSTFKALGMDSGMVGKFAPVLLDYIKQYATPENVSLLKQAWSAFL
ncbi:DUF2780 domain-containing protein [Hydrogenimonas sp.]|uniref:DUF2780 domain-containing protein n=1 Tax=Hydrogenimonas sp. TaxID=2231112 RepID=UPI0026352252|nr:DUF2780 domain-containing protein [Hydrogenimonas sp.]